MYLLYLGKVKCFVGRLHCEDSCLVKGSNVGIDSQNTSTTCWKFKYRGWANNTILGNIQVFQGTKRQRFFVL